MMPNQSFSPSDLVRIEARALEALAQRLDGTMLEAFQRATELVVACADSRRHVILLGIGKSGLIARKIAATLTSTGTPSHFLHPSEALHGDMGILSSGDIAIAQGGGESAGRVKVKHHRMSASK